jgi:hypothetical protein
MPSRWRRSPGMNKLKSRIPTRQEILPVFSIILFIDFSWMLYRMFWQVPSWLYYLSIPNILVIAAYALSFALFESSLVLGLMIFFSLIFPIRHFRDKFILQGSALAMVIGIGAWLVQRKIGLLEDVELQNLIIYPIGFLIILIVLVFVFSYIFDRFKYISQFITYIADRMTVFAYIYIPLGLLGLAVVLLRNIF